ncbi:bifunctional helix-turn-helix transcriptional regulator/GNAT family N-acetyltransferase [Streptomonospora salina]|uniref:DNA-binding MarR family transcriptional regulator/GNAT superfamily N-acetyltransferase n=1 Tax=Streptomonospora salina TaxID=104205 RepID=A0A841E9Z6_9ACTN|nr:helix-turn-helix domain-containing GNAT family N-acetyltransferase [Streptomonospora salina]MBB5999284.1 DNA-binding MarR family transcriptional regulator/GNAT superfamily N-acetyltransferase [Streptomonospora salina]
MNTPATGTGVPPEDVSAIRAFNRFYTHRVGVVKPGMLDSPWSLTEVRILYELRHRSRVEALDLRRDLDMDAGQLSRVLTRLQRNGLVARSPSSSDRRRQVVELTDEGTEAAATLDDRANEQVVGLVSHLSEGDRDRLIGAMGTVRRLFDEPRPRTGAEHPGARAEPPQERGATPTASEPAYSEAALREPRPGDLGWIVERHGTLYADEYGWDSSFEAWVAGLVADYARAPDRTGQHLWIAELDGLRAGCIACTREDERTARLRLFLVEPTARGRGVGGLLMRRCLDFARSAGYRRMVLSTYSVLAAARRVYEGSGFHLASAQPERVFGRDLTAQVWERGL